MKKKPVTENESQIGNLLERYKKRLQPPQATIERLAIDVIKDTTGLTLEAHHVSYTVATKTLYLKTPSLIRSELKQHYPKILGELKKQTSEQTAPTTIL